MGYLQSIGWRVTSFGLAFCITILSEKLRCRNIVTVDWSSILNNWIGSESNDNDDSVNLQSSISGIINLRTLVVWLHRPLVLRAALSSSRHAAILSSHLASHHPLIAPTSHHLVCCVASHSHCAALSTSRCAALLSSCHAALSSSRCAPANCCKASIKQCRRHQMPPPLSPLHAVFIAHRRHRHHRCHRCRHLCCQMLHPCALTKKEAAAPPPLVYQRQHHREHVYKSRQLELIKLIYSIWSIAIIK